MMRTAIREAGAALDSAVQRHRPLGGGDINEAAVLDLADGRRVFLKYNGEAYQLPGLFIAEAAGLEALRAHSPTLKVPEVLAVGDAWLALQWADFSGRVDPGRLGRGLAELHRATQQTTFGFEQPTYLGRLRQCNDKCSA